MKRKLYTYEDQLLKERLLSKPNVNDMEQRLNDFILLCNGKDQRQLNYMKSFLQEYVHEISRATDITVEDLKDKLYNQKHQDTNLEAFRRKVLEGQFNNEINQL